MKTALRILHVSDLHGQAARQAEALIADVKPDWIILTGDMLPDFRRIQGESSRLNAQREWWQAWRTCFLREGARTTYCLGNHEIEGFSDPSLRAVPSELAGQVALIQGIPARWGAWGFSREWEDSALQQEVDAHGEPMVVLGHVPPVS